MNTRQLPQPSVGTIVDIHYRRLGSPAETYRQTVLESRSPGEAHGSAPVSRAPAPERNPAGIVTFQPRTPIDVPVAVAGSTILEPGSPVVWFTFPGAWHDIGLFHLADGTFTGLYANVLTPVEFLDERSWATTDLCLDLWAPPDGPAQILDETELAEAEAAGLVAAVVAGRARQEAAALLEASVAGRWPPALVREWSLKRAREACRRPTPLSASPPEPSRRGRR